MRIDVSVTGCGSDSVPPAISALIERVKNAPEDRLVEELEKARMLQTILAKTELCRWADVLNRCDDLLARATEVDKTSNSLVVDSCPQMKKTTIQILRFTSLLFECSSTRRVYSSTDRLLALLESADLEVVAEVLRVLQTISKRSKFLTQRLPPQEQGDLVRCLTSIAQCWSGKLRHVKMVDCVNNKDESFPTFFPFSYPDRFGNIASVERIPDPSESLLEIVDRVTVGMDKEHRYNVLAMLRMMRSFNNKNHRLMCLIVRLLSISTLIYCRCQPDESQISHLLYTGFIEETAGLLKATKIDSHELVDAIQTEALRTLTSIVSLEKPPKVDIILDSLSGNTYHGFLANITRSVVADLCLNQLGAPNKPSVALGTALFSFIYHISSVDTGGEALVASGLMSTLLSVLEHKDLPLEHISFATRCARIIDIFATVDAARFNACDGMKIFVERLVHEVDECRKEQPFVIDVSGDTDEETYRFIPVRAQSVEKRCHQQRSGLIKGLLTFIKRIIQDNELQDSVRRIMEGSLPNSIIHILSNAEFYSDSIYYHSIQLVSNFVFQEPAQLAQLQKMHLPYVILQSILRKELPNSKDVIIGLGHCFTALCLNEKGLRQFKAYKPFDHVFRILLSIKFIATLKKKRSEMHEAAGAIGQHLDDLLRHQPTLRQHMLEAVIDMMNELIELGYNPPPNTKIVMALSRNASKAAYQTFASGSGGVSPENEIAPDPEEEQEDRAFSPREEPSDDDEDLSMDDAPPATEAAAVDRMGLEMDCPAEANDGTRILPLGDYMTIFAMIVESIISHLASADTVEEFIAKDSIEKLIKLAHIPAIATDSSNGPLYMSIAAILQYTLTHQKAGERMMNAILDQFSKHIPDQLLQADSSVLQAKGASYLAPLGKEGIANSVIFVNATIPILSQLLRGSIPSNSQLASDRRWRNHEAWLLNPGKSLHFKLRQVARFFAWELTLIKLVEPRKNVVSTQTDPTDVDAGSMGDTAADTKSEDRIMSMELENCCEGVARTEDLSKASWELAGISEDEMTFWRDNKATGESVVKANKLLSEFLNVLAKSCFPSSRRNRRYEYSFTTGSNNKAGSKIADHIFTFIYKELKWTSPRGPNSPMEFGHLHEILQQITSILFDERKYPFHAMLDRFYSSGCHQAFCEILNEKLAPALAAQPSRYLEQAFTEWFRLADRLSNKNKLINSTYKAWQTVPHFDAEKYARLVHNDLFRSISTLFLRLSDESVNLRLFQGICESALNVYKEVAQSLVQEEESAVANEKRERTQGDEQIQFFLEMGFDRAEILLALAECGNAQEATEWLIGRRQQADAVVDLLGQQHQHIDEERPVDSNDAPVQPLEQPGPGTSVDALDSVQIGSPEEITAPIIIPLQELNIENENSVSQGIIDLMPLCKRLMEFGSELVFSCADLVLSVADYLDKNWKKNQLLSQIMMEDIIKMTQTLSTATLKPSDQQITVLATRIHFACLLFEYLADEYLEVVSNHSPQSMVGVMLLLISYITENFQERELHMRLLPPVLLWFDLYDKCRRQTLRKQLLEKFVPSKQLKWMFLGDDAETRYTARAGKRFNAYPAAQQAIINKAFFAGKSSVTFRNSRSKDILVDFIGMKQRENDLPRTTVIVEFPESEGIDAFTVADIINEENTSVWTRKEEDDLLVQLILLLQKGSVTHLAVHSILSCLVRLTKDRKMADLFIEKNGIQAVLQLRSMSTAGSTSLVSLIIRQCIDNKDLNKSVVERHIRLCTNPSTQTFGILGVHEDRPKDWDDSLNKMMPIAVKHPDIFVEAMSRLAKIIPGANGTSATIQCVGKLPRTCSECTPAMSQVIRFMLDEIHDGQWLSASCAPLGDTRMLSRAEVLRMIAEIVKTHNVAALLVCESKRDGKSYLYVLLEKFICDSDKETMKALKSLFSVIAGLNNMQKAQESLVSDVKASILATDVNSLPSVICTRVTELCAIMVSMSDHCPAPGPPNRTPGHSSSNQPNAIVKMFHKKKMCNDLVKMITFLQLSSKECQDACSDILKTLETLLKNINPQSAAGIGPGGNRADTASQVYVPGRLGAALNDDDYFDVDHIDAEGAVGTIGRQIAEIRDRLNRDRDEVHVQLQAHLIDGHGLQEDDVNQLHAAEDEEESEQDDDDDDDDDDDENERDEEETEQSMSSEDIDHTGEEHEEERPEQDNAIGANLDDSQQVDSVEDGEGRGDPMELEDLGNNDGGRGVGQDETEDEEDEAEDDYEDIMNNATFDLDDAVVDWSDRQHLVMGSFLDDWGLLNSPFVLRRDAMRRMRLRTGTGGAAHPMLVRPHHIADDSSNSGLAHQPFVFGAGTLAQVALTRQNAIRRMNTASRTRPVPVDRRVYLDRMFDHRHGVHSAFIGGIDRDDHHHSRFQACVLTALERYQEGVNFLEPLSVRYISVLINHIVTKVALEKHKEEEAKNKEAKEAENAQDQEGAAETATVVAPPLAQVARTAWRTEDGTAPNNEEVDVTMEEPVELGEEQSAEDVSMDDAPPPSSAATAASSVPEEVEGDITTAMEESLDGQSSFAMETSETPAPTSPATVAEPRLDQPPEAEDTSTSGTQPPQEEAGPSNPAATDSEQPASSNGMVRVPEEFREILGDIEIPDGIDPAFLAALPDDMRAEVIRDHERQQRAQRVTAAAAAATAPAPGAPAVAIEPIDQEFLAALPPELQEEIIQQHERAVREAEEALRRANDPTPPAQPAEVDGAAVIASLPPRERQQVLAEMDETELQRLPQAMQDEARRARSQMAAQLEPMFHRSVMRIHHLYMRGDRRGQNRSEGPRIGQMAGKLATANQQAVQLLDREAILTLCGLFLETKISVARLQKVVRLVCSHAASCDFVIWCLRALLDQASLSNNDDDEIDSHCPKWLDSIVMPGVGQNERCIKIAKDASKVWVHPLTSSSVCRNVLDALHTLAKTFPGHFVPPALRSEECECRQMPSTNQFWLALMNPSSKPIIKDHPEPKDPVEQLHNCPLAHLINYFSQDSFNSQSQLQDRLLKLLHAIIQTLPDDTMKRMNLPKESAPLSEHLRQILNILMKGSCGQEGFADGRSLILEAMRVLSPRNSQLIYDQMCTSVKEIGLKLKPQIEELLEQLKEVPTSSEDDQRPSSSSEKGRITSARLQGESVIVDGDAVAKHAAARSCPELRVPAVMALTDKAGAQYNLLSSLQTLTKVRDAMRLRKEQRRKQVEEEAKKAAEEKEKENKENEEKKEEESSAAASETAPAPTPTPADQPSTSSATDVPPADIPEFVSIEKEDVRLSQILSELDDLWNVVSSCLLRLGRASDPHAVVALQPAAEAFFLVHAVNKVSVVDNEHPDNVKMIEFAEKHREVLNQVLRQNSQTLSPGGPFAILTHFPKLLDFDVKRKYFRKELTKIDGERDYRRADINVQVRRSQLFSDSFRELCRLRPAEWKKRFYIVFQGEEGQDAGGLLREWYSVITREIFNPNYALFITAPGDMVTYMINRASYINPEHLDYFKFVGRLIAKAIYDNKLLDCYFTRAFYKHILNLPVKYQDIESEDPAFFKSLDFLLTNPINDLALDLTFSLEVEEYGVRSVRELKPDGHKIEVNDENKHEYVNLVCQMKMTGSIRRQLDSFLSGFYEIIPRQLISMFNEQELELLISGLPDVDIDDLANNTEYKGYTKTSPQIQWFWRALRSFEPEDRAKFLQFVTGTSKVPLQGFGSLEGMNGVQKFSIHMDSRGGDRLPAAHTCFNQIDLPQYETFEKLRDSLLLAIRECTEGFGFA